MDRSRTDLKGFADLCLTAWLPRRFGARNETRTRDPDLGKVVLYQLSYSRTFDGFSRYLAQRLLSIPEL